MRSCTCPAPPERLAQLLCSPKGLLKGSSVLKCSPCLKLVPHHPTSSQKEPALRLFGLLRLHLPTSSSSRLTSPRLASTRLDPTISRLSSFPHELFAAKALHHNHGRRRNHQVCRSPSLSCCLNAASMPPHSSLFTPSTASLPVTSYLLPDARFSLLEHPRHLHRRILNIPCYLLHPLHHRNSTSPRLLPSSPTLRVLISSRPKQVACAVLILVSFLSTCGRAPPCIMHQTLANRSCNCFLDALSSATVLLARRAFSSATPPTNSPPNMFRRSLITMPLR